MTDLIEENTRLKKENKELMDLLANLTEQTKWSVDFWRNNYITLLRQVEMSPGERPRKGRRTAGRTAAANDA